MHGRGDHKIETDANGVSWVVAPYSLVDADLPGLHTYFPEPGSTVLGARCRVPADKGTGWWDMIELDPGLYLLIVNTEYLEDRLVRVPGDRTIKIRVLLSGTLHHIETNSTLEGTGAFLEAYPGEIGSGYVLSAGMPTRMVIVSVAPELIVDRLRLGLDDLPAPLPDRFRLDKGDPEGAVTPLGPDVLRAANDIMRIGSQFSPPLIETMLRVKCYEIICSMLQQMMTARDTGGGPSLTVRDVGRIYEARDLLLDQFARPPSISRLARMVGVNQTKLKASFKAVFNVTIYDFIQRCRMERATELLMTSPLSIAEIAYAVGFEYPANFTHAFKRFYGHLPRQVRRAQGAVIDPDPDD
jgi:AraC family transcriptional activator of pyochelin receptor